MTREQAIEVLIDRYNSGVIRRRTDDEWRLATDTVIVALRGPQPDPITGLVPCGCGGKADCNDTGIMSKDGKPLWWVECTGCGISTYGHQQKDEAKAAWNRAMSGATP